MPKVIDEEKVFAAVLDILVTHGYENATTKGIAAAAGFHEATLFRKYGNKASLIEKAVEAQLSATPLSRLQYTGDLKSDLVAIVDAYIETNRTHGSIIPALLFEIPQHPELKDALSRPLINIQAIIDIIQRYQEQGLLKQESPLSAVSSLIGPIMVQQMFRRAVSNMTFQALSSQEHVDAFLHGRVGDPQKEIGDLTQDR